MQYHNRPNTLPPLSSLSISLPHHNQYHLHYHCHGHYYYHNRQHIHHHSRHNQQGLFILLIVYTERVYPVAVYEATWLPSNYSYNMDLNIIVNISLVEQALGRSNHHHHIYWLRIGVVFAVMDQLNNCDISGADIDDDSSSGNNCDSTIDKADVKQYAIENENKDLTSQMHVLGMLFFFIIVITLSSSQSLSLPLLS